MSEFVTFTTGVERVAVRASEIDVVKSRGEHRGSILVLRSGREIYVDEETWEVDRRMLREEVKRGDGSPA